MEVLTKKQTCFLNSTATSSSKLSIMQKHSQTISKNKPKIRIIHIYAPEIIKTDVENFRELVQRLTGKPTENNIKKRPRISRKKPIMSKKMEVRNEFKGEEEIWGGVDMNGGGGGGFLSGFSEFDGLMGELNEFPFLHPLDDASHNMDACGEPQLV